MKQSFLCIIILTCIISVKSFAQPEIKAQKEIGGNYSDWFSNMYLTKDKGIIVGGYSTSCISGDKTENIRGGYDYWIIKMDSTYKIQWDKTIGGSDQDYLSDLLQTSDYGYLVGGFSQSNISSEKTENSRGGDDYWVIRLDSSGTIQWDKTIGGNGTNDRLTSLQQTTGNGYILGGQSDSNISGEKTQDSRGGFDYWLVKLDSTGKIIWDKTIGGNNTDGLTSVQQTSDEGYILGGYSWSDISGEKTENSRGQDDYWVVKLDSLGNIQWDKTIGGSLADKLNALRQTSDGGYILGGYSTSGISGEKTENSRGKEDYWVVKLDSMGKIQWNKTIGGSDYDELTSLQETYDGGYILAGYSFSNISGEKTENSRGDEDYWVVKLDSQGNIQWDKTIGGNDPDEAYSVIEISGNNYIVGGYSQSRISGDKKTHSRGGRDYWGMKLVYNKTGRFETTELPKENKAKASKLNNGGFTVYPNPARDQIYIQANTKAIVSLIDQSGKTLLRKSINGSTIINIAGVSPGLYYLKNNTTGVVQKIIINR
ncbi:T9SS type A sorting domain-containing protein [Panacibacter ginsenosidivorans]|uniref:T9SS type A sorting domain-containing protein n=1 Tax=Panacibacter ginsenosidivorans TaxID=1813871 RepID=A0A5B8V7A6_9BACT|nr:T9SS type A sorting domain-containing protein [Panacibacter ginsenosidivorans]QEC66793.1 T9SS type A sorting domain-containing protein [Panacibacter ginsenosidivorans]